MPPPNRPSAPPPLYRPGERRPDDAASGPSEPYVPLAASGSPGRAPAAPRPVSHTRSGVISLLSFVALAVVGVVAAIAVFLVAVPPSALLRDEIAAAVKARTGRDLTIAGASSFTLFPLGLSMEKVSLSAPPGMGGTPAVEMAALGAALAPWPLLSGKIEVERLVLRKPVVLLRVDKEGRKTWDFSRAHGSNRVQLAQATSDSRNDAEPLPAGNSRPRPAGRDLTLRAIDIENGTIRYVDERKDVARDITAVAATIALDAAGDALDAKGNAVWTGENVTFDGRLVSFSEILDGAPAKISLVVASPSVEAAYDGRVGIEEDRLALDGAVTAKGPSSARFAKWLGVELPFSRGRDGAFSLAATVATAPDLVTFRAAKLDMRGLAASGAIEVETGGARPVWRGKLTVAELDLDKEDSGASDPKSAAPDPIDDLLRRDGTRVKGYSKRAGWSEEPIDWSFLEDADATFELDVGRVRRDGVEAGPGRVKLSLRDATLDAAFEDMTLYGGKSRGVVTMDGKREPAHLRADVSAVGVDLGRFLGDASTLDWLSGAGKASVAVEGRGKTELQIVEGLAGSAKIDVADGAVAGWNIDKILRNIADGKLPNLERKASEKTAFETLSASFKIKDGVASNQDLALKSELLDVSGSGKASLGRREIDYTLRPRLAASEGSEKTAALDVPVRLAGPWAKPKFSADFKNVLKDPEKAVDAIKEIGKKLKGKKLGDIVRGLLGDGEGKEAGGGAERGDPPRN